MPKKPRVRAVAGEVSATDPAIYEQFLKPWELYISPTEGGAFKYQMRYLKLPGITVYRETFSLRCNLQGISPANTLALAVPIAGVGRSTYWGSSLNGSSSMPTMLPGGLDVKLARGHEQLLVLFNWSDIYSALPPDTIESLETSAASRFIRTEANKLNRFRAFLCGLLDGANHSADSLDNTAVSRTIAKNLYQQLDTVVQSTKQYSKPPALSREKGLRSALSYLQHSDPSTLTIPDLSRAAGVSQRTLEYAFQDHFGMTPLAFLRLKRMHAARQDLLHSSRESTTVTRIALRHGFHHPARFARYYRQMFGEAPSVTLTQSAGHPYPDRPPLL